MDFISGKQDVRIEFNITNIIKNNIPREDIIRRYQALLVWIEGGFKILIDGAVFLEDEYMNVLELGVQLLKWLKKQEDFCFDSMSSEDKCIIKFTAINEAEYIVSSSWSELKAFIATKEELLKAVKSYIENTNVLLKKTYNIKIYDFI